jgi:uncharacterized protein (DUF433 family)
VGWPITPALNYISFAERTPTMTDWHGRIVSDPDTLFGKPRISGTRIGVEFVLDLLASGWSEAQILDSYPHVKQQDLEAVFAFVRDCMKDETFIMQAAGESGQVPA